MKIGKVIGNLWATRKAENLKGQKFLIIKVLKEENVFKDELIVSCDMIGAGFGDLVLITDGSSARKTFEKDNIPIDSVVVGIIDSLEF